MARGTTLLLVALAGCFADPTSPVMFAGGAPDARTTAPDTGPVISAGCAASDRDGDGFGTDPACDEVDCDEVDCDDQNAAIHPGAPEACNGLDDDCDDAIDEELGEGSCGVGACFRTVPHCEGGAPRACVPGEPSEETCNGIDDDCNGVIDDDALGGETCGVGECRRSATCDAACVPGEPSPEVCNRLDDDCDQTIDNGFRAEVVVGSYAALAFLNPTCDGGTERLGASCNEAMQAACLEGPCATSGFGPVENSGDVAVYTCVAAEPDIEVSYATLASFHGPCDGQGQRTGPDCNAAIHRYCGSLGYASGFGPLTAAGDPTTITCLTNDQATVINTTYSVLVTHHGGCDAGSRIGVDCNAAIHRFCASQGHTSGFGPVENFGDNATITCVDP